MSFIEQRIFGGDVLYDSIGGPEFHTTVVVTASGHESRNSDWAHARGTWDLGSRTVRAAKLEELNRWFRVARGRAHGFRWRDWRDYACLQADGRLGDGLGTGMPTYQLRKIYGVGGLIDVRDIRKPVAGTVAVYRNGAPALAGAGAGQYALDTATGIVTWVADATSNASSITPGATTQVVLAANPGTLSAGQKLYLTGFAGADAALVNGVEHPINSVTGSGPFTFTLATVTTGKTITLGSGQGRKYPQAADALAWAGEFDVPVRFDIDKYSARFVAMQGSERVYMLEPVPLIELRT